MFHQKNKLKLKVSKERIANLLINEAGDILLDNEVVTVGQILPKIKPRIVEKIELPANKKLIVSVKTDANTNYNRYIQALDQVKEAYFEVREEYAQKKWGKRVIDLNEEQMNEVKDKIPIIISIAEPEVVKKIV